MYEGYNVRMIVRLIFIILYVLCYLHIICKRRERCLIGPNEKNSSGMVGKLSNYLKTEKTKE